jgi:hypothetical protein
MLNCQEKIHLMIYTEHNSNNYKDLARKLMQNIPQKYFVLLLKIK